MTAGGRLLAESGFRRWRQTRPFWAGAWTVFAGLEIGYWPLAPVQILLSTGLGGISAMLFTFLLVTDGVVIWLAPQYRRLIGVQAVVIGLIAVVTTNLGGFFVGTFAAILGGAMAFNWLPPQPVEEPEPHRPKPAPSNVEDEEVERAEHERRPTLPGFAVLLLAGVTAAALVARPVPVQADATVPVQADATVPTPVVVSARPYLVTIASLTLYHPVYEGNIRIMRADGSTVTAMHLHFDVELSGITLIDSTGVPLCVHIAQADLHDVDYYATKLQATALGLARLTFTPQLPPVVADLLPVLPLTQVVLDTVYFTFGSASIAGLDRQLIGSGSCTRTG